MKLIIVRDVSSLTDARYCAGMGADYIFFSTSQVSPEQFKEITGWLSGIRVGIEVETDLWEDVEALLLDYPCEAILTNVEEMAMIEHLNVLVEQEDGRFTLYENKVNEKLNLVALNDVSEVDKLTEQVEIQGVVLTASPETRPGFKDMDSLIELFELLEEYR